MIHARSPDTRPPGGNSMTTTSVAAAGGEGPEPGRRRIAAAAAAWVRRRPLVAVLGALVLLTLGVRLLWGGYLSHQLAARLQELRSAGQPTTLREIAVDEVPDAENAWLIFARAAAA